MISWLLFKLYFFFEKRIFLFPVLGLFPCFIGGKGGSFLSDGCCDCEHIIYPSHPHFILKQSLTIHGDSVT